MTVLTVTSIAVVVNNKSTAKSAVLGAGMGVAAGEKQKPAAVAAAVAGGTAGGAITGASEGQTVESAVLGAVAGGAAAGGVSCGMIGAYGLFTAGLAAGPIGWLLVGTNPQTTVLRATYDCWKPILHDTSKEPSTGMLLQDLCKHPHIKYTSFTAEKDSLPEIILENIWNEKFKIEYLVLPGAEQILGHAKKV